ncbi:MAG: nitroreductase family deazaflavin-dependent oxidoreductase [Anaerolineae bacterium]
MNLLMRAVFGLASSRPGTWLFLHVFPHIDRPLLRLSGGRLSLSLGQPILLLTTRGARTGQPRSSPLMYVADGERVALIASNGGRPRHPAWYHNLRANPEATLTLRGETRRYRAREAAGAERQRLWAKAVGQYLGYATYQRRAGERPIPVMVLEPL